MSTDRVSTGNSAAGGPSGPDGGDGRDRAGIEALRRAKEILGTEAALARIVGVTQPAVHYMLTRGKRVPAEWCRPIETATGGRVTRQDLRLDLFGD